MKENKSEREEKWLIKFYQNHVKFLCIELFAIQCFCHSSIETKDILLSTFQDVWILLYVSGELYAL